MTWPRPLHRPGRGLGDASVTGLGLRAKPSLPLEAMDGEPPSPKRRRTDADNTARRNTAHRAVVAARLSEQLDAVRLEPALTELAAIALACDDQGVEFAMFEALDELMQTGMERDADLGAVISAEAQPGSGGAAAAAAAAAASEGLLALVGRYCQLWERPALALGHFRAAVEAATLRGADPDPTAQRGLAQCTGLLRWRQEALHSCMRWWTAPHTAPPYFSDSGLQAFRRMATRPSDVIMTSYPKCGTSWLHAILFSLLHMDHQGEFPCPEEGMLGSAGQVYPDSLPETFAPSSSYDAEAGSGLPDPRLDPDLPACERDHREFGFAATGRWCFQDMLAQAEPRLFSTHIRAAHLPIGPDQQHGRLIVIARNPKDAIVSAHFFHKKLAAKGAAAGASGISAELAGVTMQGTCDAWNAVGGDSESEHGSYGSYYSWHRDQVDLVERLGPERGLITFYETLKDDFADEVIHSMLALCWLCLTTL